jgi:nucleotide-binding universal stress UspA family protein
MNQHRAFAIRRILVALDASPHSLAALEAAAELAARMEAELVGLFVEDVQLLRLADFPYVRQVRYFSPAGAPLIRAEIESELKAQSEQARRALAEAAQRARIHWSFRTVRGEVTHELLAAAREVDLVAIGRCGWSVGGRLRVGSTAAGVVAGAIPVLVLSERGAPYVQLLVYYDGSPSARRRLLAAAQLARGGSMGITVLVATANAESAERMRKEADALLQDSGVKVRYQLIDPTDAASLLRAVKAEKSGIIVVGGRASLGKLLDALLAEVEVPLLLLGNGNDSENEAA